MTISPLLAPRSFGTVSADAHLDFEGVIIMLCVAQGPTIEWRAVTVHQPCRVCGAIRGCRFQPSGDLVCCVNNESDRPLTNGAWLHKVDASSPETAFGSEHP